MNKPKVNITLRWYFKDRAEKQKRADAERKRKEKLDARKL
jgi:hypothetical protein